jgi:hypothetical protein
MHYGCSATRASHPALRPDVPPFGVARILSANMPELSVRFGVGDGITRRATTWKCWAVRGTGRNDVYLANRHLRGALKASLHESGTWQVGFNRRYLDAHAPREEWPTRIVDKWDRPKELAPGVTLAYRILTPSASVNTTPTADERSRIVWIVPPPDGRAVEIALVLTAPTTVTTDWPGRRSLGTSLVGHFTLDNGHTAWIVSRIVDMPQIPNLTVNRERYFSGRTRVDVGPNTRAILFRDAPDGSHVMYDVVLMRTE